MAAMSSSIRVLAFAGARDVVGSPEVDFDLPSGRAELTAGELMTLFCARYPGLLPYQRAIRLAVNGAYARPTDAVRAGDEVALIPPVAGG